jgi:hypothetical protein
MLVWLLTKELESMWIEAVVALFEVGHYPWHFHTGAEIKNEIPLKIWGVLSAAILIQNFANTRQ